MPLTKIKDSNTDLSKLPLSQDASSSNEAARLSQIPVKNGIVNGAMLVMQDGSGLTGIAHATYIADNFQYRKDGTVVHNASHVIESTSPISQYVFGRTRLTLTTAQSSLSANNYCNLDFYIEGYQWSRYRLTTFTLQFLVKLPVVGTYCVAVRNDASDYSYVAEFNYTTANTDQLVTLTIPAPPVGTWNFTNGVGARISLVLASGTTWHGSVGWQSGNKIATANQVNSLNAAVNSVYELALVRIDSGPVSHAWHPEDFDFSLVLEQCRRYYETSYEYGVVPGTANSTNGVEGKIAINTVDYYDYGTIRFKTTKRVTPGINVRSPVTGTDAQIRDITANVDRGVSVNYIGQNGFRVYGSTLVANNAYQMHWVGIARF